MILLAQLLQRLGDEGELHPVGIGEDAAMAAGKLMHLRSVGMTVDDCLKQAVLADPDLTDIGRDLLDLFNRFKRSPKKIGALLENYADAVISHGHPGQAGLFGGDEPPTKAGLLEMAVTEPNVGVPPEERKGHT